MSDRDRDDEELAEVAAELTRELREFRTELEREHRRRGPPRGPLGLPRPPTPGEVLRFADEFAIPTVIAILEANIKLLEGLQGVIRLADAGREARERGRTTRDRAVEGASEAGRRTLSQLEDSLADLRRAIESGSLPEDSEGRELLDDIRDLQEEIDDRLGRSRDRSRRDLDRERRSRGRPGDDGRDGAGPTDPGEDDAEARAEDEGDPVEIDVDAELDSLRERYREDDAEDGSEGGDDDGAED